MRRPLIPRTRSAHLALSIAFACAGHASGADGTPPVLDLTGSDAPLVPEVTVFGTMDRRTVDEIVPTVSVIEGARFERAQRSTLGETLSRQAGVSATSFGPNASRPVIRGLDGDRVRILQNGVGTIDASGTSPDHAVPIDPFLVDRVETIRGSAALLYGNSAIGGVVNTVDSRIPERLSLDPSLRFQSIYSSHDKGRNAAVAYDGTVGKFAYHLDGIARGSSDVSIPGYARSAPLRAQDPLPAGETEDRDHLPNSQNKVYEGALGGSYVFDRGYVGAAFSGFDTHYGTVAEKGVSIVLRRERVDVAGEVRTDRFIESARIKSAVSYYKHQEFEGPEVGTTFRNRGIESRLDLKHRKIGPVDGVIGFQEQHSRFSALGEEAFVPTTNNSSVAAFLFEEAHLGDWTPSVGARLDRSGVRSEDDANFGPGVDRDYWASSVSAGGLYRIDGAFSLGLNATMNERAPNYQELFADGPHVATGIHEIGDRELKKERSRGLELSVRHRNANGSGRVSAFVQDFSNFIALRDSGTVDPADGLPVYDYSAVRARLYGAEVEYRQELPFRIGAGVFDLEARFDWLRGRDRTTRANLPRMTPVREGLALGYTHPVYSTSVEAERSEAQTRLAPNELGTDAYTLFNLNGEVPLAIGARGAAIRLVAQVRNLFDTEARNAVSFLKDVAPLPGRSFVAGFRGNF